MYKVTYLSIACGSQNNAHNYADHQNPQLLLS